MPEIESNKTMLSLPPNRDVVCVSGAARELLAPIMPSCPAEALVHSQGSGAVFDLDFLVRWQHHFENLLNQATTA